MEISKRLKMVANCVTKGNILADVGTDHGYVPIYLVKNYISPSAIAMDINKGPLEKAILNIKNFSLEKKIQTRLSNGLDKLNPMEVESVVIAGMGGELICNILQSKPVTKEFTKELILSPHSEWYKVRKYLINNHFYIVKEDMIVEEDKYYVVIKANCDVLNENEQVYNEADFKYGKYLIENKNMILAEYLLKEQNNNEKIYRTLIDIDNKKTKERKLEIENNISIIKDTLKRINN